MGFNASSLVIPGKGTVLVAAPDTAPPNYLTIDPTGTVGGGWEALGHTSRDNNVSLSKSGGDASTVGSWWDEAVRSTYSATEWSVIINSIQIDALTLGLAFGGGALDTTAGAFDVPGTVVPQNKALLILIVDGPTRMGIYIPNTTVTIGDAPQIATDAFFEIQLSAQILNSPTTGKRFRILHPALRTAPPTVTAATPANAQTGTLVTITGSKFIGTTAVKFGSAFAPTFSVTSDDTLQAVMPAGTAGSANIIVTNANGDSSAFTYTRGA